MADSGRQVPAGARIVGVGGVVVDDAGRVLLVLRRNEPQAGFWSLPGGKVEPDESLPEALAREMLEETGLIVEVGEQAWVVDIPTGDGTVYEVHDFHARVCGGKLQAADDAADAAWFTPEELATAKLTSGLVGYLVRAGVVEDLAVQRGYGAGRRR